jgi:hypothetical protein
MSYTLLPGFGAEAPSKHRRTRSPVPITSGGFVVGGESKESSDKTGATLRPDRCVASGRYWDPVTGQCLDQPPPSDDSGIVTGPNGDTVEDTVVYDPELDCIDAGGCWDSAAAECVQCPTDVTGGADDTTTTTQPDDNTAMYVGIGLLLAAGLAGGYFLISRKKKGKP